MTRAIAGNEWHPASWQSREAAQQPNYPDSAALERAIAELSRLPPIVTSWEVDKLRQLIAKAQAGQAFVLQGGDCAESFDYCTSESIVAKLKILLMGEGWKRSRLVLSLVMVSLVARMGRGSRSTRLENRSAVAARPRDMRGC